MVEDQTVSVYVIGGSGTDSREEGICFLLGSDDCCCCCCCGGPETEISKEDDDEAFGDYGSEDGFTEEEDGSGGSACVFNWGNAEIAVKLENDGGAGGSPAELTQFVNLPFCTGGSGNEAEFMAGIRFALLLLPFALLVFMLFMLLVLLLLVVVRLHCDVCGLTLSPLLLLVLSIDALECIL